MATEDARATVVDPDPDLSVEDEYDDAADPESPSHLDEPGKHKRSGLVEWIIVVVVAISSALLVRAYVLQQFAVEGTSMLTTLHPSDRVLVNKLSYHLHDVHRGDIVVFERPANVPDTGIKDLIKRVVGLPGEVIESKDGEVYVDGHRIKEPYLDRGVRTVNLDRQKIGDDEVFVMGDNRTNSEDSRIFGPIDEDLLVGRAFIRVWPPFQFRLL
jgi:signal peptidase I